MGFNNVISRTGVFVNVSIAFCIHKLLETNHGKSMEMYKSEKLGTLVLTGHFSIIS